jgi:uncharacterized coiled-coil DUF342 family protein
MMSLYDYLQRFFCSKLRRKNNRLTTKVKGLEEKVDKLVSRNEDLADEVNSVRKNNEDLRRTIEEYKSILSDIEENKVL